MTSRHGIVGGNPAEWLDQNHAFGNNGGYGCEIWGACWHFCIFCRPCRFGLSNRDPLTSCLTHVILYIHVLTWKLLLFQEAFGAFHNDASQVAKYLKPMHIGTVKDKTDLDMDRDFRTVRDVATTMVIYLVFLFICAWNFHSSPVTIASWGRARRLQPWW